MGFFKKIFKGIKKFVKKVGRGIKKVVGKVGKFMGKIGIVGQIAMSFMLPGIGTMLGNTLGSLGSFGAGLANSTNMLAKTAGTIIKGAADAASWAGRTFKTVSSAVSNHVGEFAKTAASKLGFNVENAATNFFGADGAFAKANKLTGETFRSGFGSLDAITKSTNNIVNTMSSQNTIKAEDLGLRPKTAPPVGEGTNITGEIFAKPPSSLLTDQQKLASNFLDPELGTAQIKDLVTSGDYAASFKPTFGTEITSQGLANLPVEQQSLLGKIGDTFVGAKDAVVSRVQDKVSEFSADPLGTAWSAVKSTIQPQDEEGYYPGEVAAVLPQVSPNELVASPLLSMPQYGNVAYLMDNYIYQPQSTWVNKIRGLT
jgi:hypothetical protein